MVSCQKEAEISAKIHFRDRVLFLPNIGVLAKKCSMTLRLNIIGLNVKNEEIVNNTNTFTQKHYLLILIYIVSHPISFSKFHLIWTLASKKS